MQSCDSLVIGGGVAGLRAALELCRYGEVIVVNKGSQLEGSSVQAQGGVAVALEDPEDVKAHYRDTLWAGKGLCREEAVQILVEEGPARIRELISWGACFDQINGAFAFAKEAAHSKERILRARGDATGEEIMLTLLRQGCSKPSIRRMENAFSTDLLIHEGRCVGALLLDETDQRFKAIFARATVLATGGIGQLYLRTTNPFVATGDGMAMAARAGALLEDMEFVQFHPTSLVLAGAPPFLLSEAMRGEGAVLRNKEGVAFMRRYHEAAELAPRDVVARAIWQEMLETGSPHVYLGVTHLPAGYLRERFPKIYRTCLQYGLDITQQRVPVAPAMHFIIGGVKVNLEGATTLDGLYAAGEVACAGVHGANRLASNSLLEGLVFGKRVGEAAGQAMRGWNLPSRGVLEQIVQDHTQRGEVDSLPVHVVSEIRRDLQRAMWEGVGIIRDRKSLEKALAFLRKWEGLILKQYVTRTELELKNLLILGKVIATACLLREESVGAHHRLDSKGGDRATPGHIALRWNQSETGREARIFT